MQLYFNVALVNFSFFQASKYIPDICVIRAVQKIVWASGCGSVQLVFSSNEEISKIYEKVRIPEQLFFCVIVSVQKGMLTWSGLECDELLCGYSVVFQNLVRVIALTELNFLFQIPFLSYSWIVHWIWCQFKIAPVL